jgi:hypothetical protein
MLFCPNTKWHGIEYEQPRFFNVKNGKYNLESSMTDDMTRGTTIEVKDNKTYFKRFGNTQLIFGKIEKHGKYIHVQVLKNNTGRHYYSTKSGNIKFKFISDKQKLECEVMH